MVPSCGSQRHLTLTDFIHCPPYQFFFTFSPHLTYYSLLVADTLQCKVKFVLCHTVPADGAQGLELFSSLVQWSWALTINRATL